MSEMAGMEVPCVECDRMMYVEVDIDTSFAYQNDEIDADDLDVERVCPKCGSDQTYDSEGNNTTAID